MGGWDTWGGGPNAQRTTIYRGGQKSGKTTLSRVLSLFSAFLFFCKSIFPLSNNRQEVKHRH